MLTRSQYQRMFEATESSGLPVNASRNMTGRFVSDYYGTLTVTQRNDGRLSINYGTVWCTLGGTPTDRTSFLCPNASLHNLPGPMNLPVVRWESSTNSWTMMGQAVWRAASMKPISGPGISKNTHDDARGALAPGSRRMENGVHAPAFNQLLRSPYLAFS